MTIPNLPTDNLYKFISLCGLFIIIFSFSFKIVREYQHEIENAEIRVGKEFFDFATEHYSLNFDYRKKNLYSQENLSIEDIDKFEKEMEADAKEFLNKIAKLGENLRLKSEMAEASVRVTDKLTKLSNYLIIIGFLMMIFGFRLWYIKSQKYQDIIIKLRAENIKSIGSE